MDCKELQRKYEVLKEKFERHEEILKTAYLKIKKQQEELIQYNEELKATEEEFRATIEEIRVINGELLHKNQIINSQNEELKTILEKLKVSQIRLIHQEKMASLGILTTGIAHEIKNPLNFIMGAYTALKFFFVDNKIELDPKTQRMMDALKEGVDRILRIIDNLKEFNSINEDKRIDCDLNEIIDNCLLLLHNRIKYRLQVEKLYSKDLPLIKANRAQMHEIFMHILNNAIDAIEGEGVIKIQTNSDEEFAVVEIEDNGVGIEKDQLHNLVDPFYTTKEAGEGTGLGLFIVYNVLKQHGGKLLVESEKGVYTKVTVKFPLK